MFKTVQTFLLPKKNIYSENPISIGQNGVRLQLIKQNQIYRQMTIYGPNQGHFKRENNEYIGTGPMTTLHKIKLYFFYLVYVVL